MEWKCKPEAHVETLQSVVLSGVQPTAQEAKKSTTFHNNINKCLWHLELQVDQPLAVIGYLYLQGTIFRMEPKEVLLLQIRQMVTHSATQQDQLLIHAIEIHSV